MKKLVKEEFDISQYITAADIASAVTAGVIAYIKNRPKVDDQQQPNAGASEQPSSAGKGAATQDAMTQTQSSTDKALFAAAKKTVPGRCVTVQGPDGKFYAVGQKPNGLLWKAPLEKDPEFGDFDFGTAIDQSGKPVYVGGFMQKKCEDLAEMGQVFKVGADGSVKMASEIASGFTAANPPSFNDTSAQAQTFWLKNPDVAKAHGITVKDVVTTPNGIQGTVQRVSQKTLDQMASDHAAVMADQALKKAANTAREMAMSASKMGKFDLAQQLLDVAKSDNVNAINSAISAASKVGVTTRW